MIKLKDLLNETETEIISEWVSYDQLKSSTDQNFPTRLQTTKNVKTSPPKFVMLRDGNVSLKFDFRSFPSVEGKSHRGYIKFAPAKSDEKSMMGKVGIWWKSVRQKFKQFVNKKIPPQILKGEDLRQMKCKVSCDCKDFKYRMEKANQLQGASDIEFSNGALPNVTNPTFETGLCKHLLGCLNHLQGDVELREEEN